MDEGLALDQNAEGMFNNGRIHFVFFVIINKSCVASSFTYTLFHHTVRTELDANDELGDIRRLFHLPMVCYHVIDNTVLAWRSNLSAFIR